MGTIVVELTVRIGYAVFTIATLSFLGAGIPPPSPDWGLTISENYQYIQAGEWWSTLFPALAIVSIWLYLVIFIFTGLWFQYYLLQALADLRADGTGGAAPPPAGQGG